jgi:hypothetical protein
MQHRAHIINMAEPFKNSVALNHKHMSAVPIHLIREKRLIRIFEAAGATEPFNAAALQDLNIDQNRALCGFSSVAS